MHISIGQHATDYTTHDNTYDSPCLLCVNPAKVVQQNITCHRKTTLWPIALQQEKQNQRTKNKIPNKVLSVSMCSSFLHTSVLNPDMSPAASSDLSVTWSLVTWKNLLHVTSPCRGGSPFVRIHPSVPFTIKYNIWEKDNILANCTLGRKIQMTKKNSQAKSMHIFLFSHISCLWCDVIFSFIFNISCRSSYRRFWRQILSKKQWIFIASLGTVFKQKLKGMYEGDVSSNIHFLCPQ